MHSNHGSRQSIWGGDKRRILAAFLGLGEGDEFDAAMLEQMTPELVFRLETIASKLLELGRTNEAVRALQEPARR